MKIGTETGRETPAADRVPGRGQQEEGGVNLGGEDLCILPAKLIPGPQRFQRSCIYLVQ